MPKLRTPTLSPEQLRTRQFIAAIEYGKVIHGIRTQEELAAATGFGTRQSLYYQQKNNYETLSIHQLRMLVKGLGLSKDVIGAWLGCKG